MNMLEAPFRALGQIGPRLIMIAAMVTSYSTQYHLFLSWGVDGLTAVIAPAVVDILVITCAEILHDLWVIRGKGAAGFVLVVAGSGSMAANWIAGVSVGSKVVHASMVLAYVLAELVVGRVRRVTQQQTAAAQTVTPEVTADEAGSPVLPSQQVITVAELAQPDYPDAPVSPAPRIGRPPIDTEIRPSGEVVNVDTGTPVSKSTAQRRRKVSV